MRVILTLIRQEVLKNSVVLCGTSVTNYDTDMITHGICVQTQWWCRKWHWHASMWQLSSLSLSLSHTHTHTPMVANSDTDMAACDFVFTNSDTTKAACDIHICVYVCWHWHLCCHILLHSTFKPNRCNFMHLQKLGIFNLKLVQVILKMKPCLDDARLLYHWTEWCCLEHWEKRIIMAISTL